MSLISELNRRNVFRVAAGYVVLSWVLLQATDLLMEVLGLPDVWGKAVLGLMVIGFIPAIIVSWVYEMTPEGLKREKDVAPAESITAHTAQKLDIAIIALLVVAIGVFAVDRFVLGPDAMPTASQAAGHSAAPDPGIPVVAVLPLQAFSKNDEGTFLASGLHDDLLTRLARLKAFRVISRTSVMEYADTAKNLRQIGAELGAGYILEGGLQAIGGNVRINAQLINATTDEHLWAETFDRELTTANLFEVQADIAGAIAEAMHATLSPQEVQQLSDVPTENLDAYQSYLHGMEDRESLTQPSLQNAVASFRNATELDPEFAEAWGELSIAQVRLYWEDGAEDDASPDLTTRDAAENSLERARSLAPDSVGTLMADAYVQYYGYRNYSNALILLGRVESIAPHDARVIALRGYLLRRLGRFSESADALLQAQTFSPNSPSLYRESMVTLVEAGRCAEAVDLRNRALAKFDNEPGIVGVSAWVTLGCEQDVGAARALALRVDVTTLEQLDTMSSALIVSRDFPAAIQLLTAARDTWIERPTHRLKVESLLTWLYRQTGQDALAGESMETAEQLSASIANPGATTLGDLALAAALRGDTTATLELGKRTLAAAPEDELIYQNFALQVVRSYAVAGLSGEALDVLEDTLKNHHFGQPQTLVLDPMLESISETDRFRALVGKGRT